MIRPARLGLTLLLLGTSACFATRNDVRILQGDILTLRQESQRADSARGRQLGQLAATLGTVHDSLREASSRMARNQGETRGEFRQVRELILQLQELVGQSTAVVARLRAEAEARELQRRQQEQAQVPVPPPADTSKPPVTPVPTPQRAPEVTGPSQLYELGNDQARRGSYGAAAAAFEELLANHPQSDLAPDAQYALADAYEADGKYAQSDSAYLLVVQKYPRSPRASTALYKLGMSLAKRGRRPDARAMMERVTREYPVSDAADLARDWLMRNR